MTKLSKANQLTITAVCIALCVVVPMAFHMIPNAGSIFCPMHIPVLLCGLVCGWQYGLICGFTGPLLSSLFTGMPMVAMLPSMMLELAVFGIVTGIMMRLVHSGKLFTDLYISLIAALIVGRLAAGIYTALFFTEGTYSLKLWFTGYFVTGWPGILIQLIFVPSIVYALEKAQLIPVRYTK